MTPEALKFTYSMIGMMVGLVLVLAGLVITLVGPFASCRRTSEVKWGKVTWKNPATGLAFASLGMAVIYFTRFSP